MNENPNENEFTAEDGEIRFDPEKDREKQTEAEVEKVKKAEKSKVVFYYTPCVSDTVCFCVYRVADKA